MTCAPHQCHTEQSQCPDTLGSTVLPSPEGHRVGITQYVAFTGCFLHLRICIHGSSVSSHGWIADIFLALNNIPLSGWAPVYPSPTEGNVGCLQIFGSYH